MDVLRRRISPSYSLHAMGGRAYVARGSRGMVKVPELLDELASDLNKKKTTRRGLNHKLRSNERYRSLKPVSEVGRMSASKTCTPPLASLVAESMHPRMSPQGRGIQNAAEVLSGGAELWTWKP